MAAYATRADLLAALSHDSQAKLSTDPSRREVCGTGDGVKTTFTTPFIETTTAKVYVDGVAVTTGWTLSRGTGTDSRDEIVFSPAPAAGKVVSVSADAAAINLNVLDAVLKSVSGTMAKYLSGVDPAILSEHAESLKAMAILFAQKRLRGRRNLDIVDPIESECREAERWLLAVAEGKILLQSPAASVSSDDGAYVFGSHTAVFSDPDEGISL